MTTTDVRLGFPKKRLSSDRTGRLVGGLIAILAAALPLRAQSNYSAPYTFTNLAGSLNEPYGVAVDSAGDIFTGVVGDGTVRMISSSGVATTIANTQIFGARCVAVDKAGNIYATDWANNTILMVAPTVTGGAMTWTVSTIAGRAGATGSTDGVGSAAWFNSPVGIAVDASGNVFVADTNNDTIREITPAVAVGVTTWTVSTIAGVAGSTGSTDGAGSAALFHSPVGVAVDSSGNVFVADANNNTIRKLTPAVASGVTTWMVSTIAGTPNVIGSTDGVGNTAKFSFPEALALDKTGNIFVADSGDDTIRLIAPTVAGGATAWTVSTIAGLANATGSTNGTGSAVLFHGPVGVAVDGAGNVYVADTTNGEVRWGALAVPAMTSGATASGAYGQSFTYSARFSGTIAGPFAASGLPTGLSIDASTGDITGIPTSNVGSYQVTLMATNGAGTASGTLTISITAASGNAALAQAPTAVSAQAGVGQAIVSFTPPTYTGGTAITGYSVTATPSFGAPVTVLGAVSPITVPGLTNGLSHVFTVAAINSAGTGASSLPSAAVTPSYSITYATTTLATLSVPSGPNGVAVDSYGNVYATAGNALERIDSSGAVSLFAGSLDASGSADGTGASALFNSPTGLAADVSGNIYVADTGNNSIRKISPQGVVSTLAGLTQGNNDGVGIAAQFNGPTAVAVDNSGNVYVNDAGNKEVRKVSITGATTTLLSSATFTFANVAQTNQAIYSIVGMAVDAAGTPYVGVSVATSVGLSASYSSYVLRIASDGSYVQVFNVLGGSSLRYSAIADGALAISGNTGIYVLEDNSLYQGTNLISGTGGVLYPAEPIAIAADEYGRVFEAIPNSRAIVVVTPVGSAPSIATQPMGAAIAFGAYATLSVGASGSPAPKYQWRVDGADVPGAISSTYTTSIPGTYTVVVSNLAGTVTSSPASVVASARLQNISSRAFVGTNADVEIAGFVVSGPPGTKEQVLIRGAGPSLAQFGVSGFLLQPVLSLFDSKGNPLAKNTGWNTATNASAVASAFASTGAFAFPLDSADSAILISLSPGSYTAQIVGLNGTTGVALAEVYEVNAGDPELINISTRAFVSSGSSVEIGGFVVKGPQSAKVIVRAIGPALSQFGISGILAQPSLSVVDSNGNSVASNTGWSANANASTIVSEMAAVGAFPLPSGSADCALLLTLPPGTYTAVVSGVAGDTGIALVEVYQAP